MTITDCKKVNLISSSGLNVNNMNSSLSLTHIKIQHLCSIKSNQIRCIDISSSTTPTLLLVRKCWTFYFG